MHLLDYQSSGPYTLIYESASTSMDLIPPVSRVNLLPADSAADFAATWDGSDVGRGIAAFDLYDIPAGTNHIAVSVSDNAIPPRIAMQTLTLIVRDRRADFTVAVGSANVFGGESNAVPVRLSTGIELRDLTVVLNRSRGRLDRLALGTFAPEVTSLSSNRSAAMPRDCASSSPDCSRPATIRSRTCASLR